MTLWNYHQWHNCTWPIIPTIAVCGEFTANKNTTSCNSTHCNYTLPDSTIVTTAAHPGDYNELVFQVSSSKGKIYNASSRTTPYIANFVTLGAPWNSETWTNVTSSECALWFCVQAYNITIENSIQGQSLVKRWSNIADIHPDDPTANRTFVNIPADFNVSPNTEIFVSGMSVRAVKGAVGFDASILNADGFQYSSEYDEALWNSSSNSTRSYPTSHSQ